MDPLLNAGLSGSADRCELERFDRLAAQWWDEKGPMAPLHRLNPVRIGYIRDRAAQLFARDPKRPRPLAGLGVLDVGCGGGLLAEPLARMGAEVVGIDLARSSLAVARRHALDQGLKITYREIALEALEGESRRFDLVCVMEVVEHLADQTAFLRCAARLVAPGGGLVVATLNRTARSFAFGIVAAEYVLGWLPRGTHDWQRFMRPSEVARALRAEGLHIADTTGVSYDPLRDRFQLCRDLGVNYMLFATAT